MKLGQSKRFEDYLGKPILALDYGTVVVGLALFCPGREPFPLPFGKVPWRGDRELVAEILEIVVQEAIEVVVLGLPLYVDGSESPMSCKVRDFGELLANSLPVRAELHYQDESLSSKEAEDRMKSSPRYNFKVDPAAIDALSACIILEEFLVAK